MFTDYLIEDHKIKSYIYTKYLGAKMNEKKYLVPEGFIMLSGKDEILKGPCAEKLSKMFSELHFTREQKIAFIQRNYTPEGEIKVKKIIGV